MERPALKQLLDDVKAGKIDIVVVYKIDRSCWRYEDFAKLVKISSMNPWRHLRFRHPEFQHHHLDGAADGLTHCCPSRSPSVRSTGAERIPRQDSPRPRPRACGWAAVCRLVTRRRSASC